MAARAGFLPVFERLSASYGPQHWWPGETAFEIMVGAILTQNTAWTNVERAIADLVRADALHPVRILETPHETLARWIRPAGYFNVKAKRLGNFCRWYLDQGGFDALVRQQTGRLRHGLLSVNGIGRETADDILLYAFGRPVFVIDSYTRRIFSRLGLVRADDGYEHLRASFEQGLTRELGCDRRGALRSGGPRGKARLYNEYHALIVAHAKHVCRSHPRCGECSLAEICPVAQ